MSDYIQLNRKFIFRHFSDNNFDNFDNFEEKQTAIYQKIEWVELLKEYRVILLAEAGSGKTSEVQNKSYELENQGKDAFCIRIESLLDDFQDAFEVGSLEKWENWQKSEKEAWLFLDSVDEAKLKDYNAFEKALKKLRKTLSDESLSRVHIILTSRIIEWRKKFDLELYMKQFPYTVEGGKSDKESNINDKKKLYKVVTFAELNKSQIEEFAKQRGIINTDSFLIALERTKLASFATDLLGLDLATKYWDEHNAIEGRTELIENSIEKRLSDWNEDRKSNHSLSNEKRRGGLETLAMAVVLTRESKICVPDGNSRCKGLPLLDLLPDLTDSERKELLGCAIFNQALYGTVRFHQRIIYEYLAAKWMYSHLEVSRKKINDLLFTKIYGTDVIIPNMKPILLWLILRDSDLCEKVIRLEPELILYVPDSDKLPSVTRERVIKSICVYIQNSKASYSSLNLEAIKSFSVESIEESICNLLEEYFECEKTLEFLVKIAYCHKIKKTLPMLKKIAIDSAKPRSVKYYAFRALPLLGTDNELQEIYQYFEQQKIIESEHFAAFVSELHVNEKNIKWIFSQLKRIGGYDEHYIGSYPLLIKNYLSNISLEYAHIIIPKIKALVKSEPFCDCHGCAISKNFNWILEPSIILMHKGVIEKADFILEDDNLLFLLEIENSQYCKHSKNYYIFQKMTSSILQWKELQISLFWFYVTYSLSKNNKENLVIKNMIFYIERNEYFKNMKYDVALQQIPNCQTQIEKEIALQIICNLMLKEDFEENLPMLQNVVVSDPVLTKRLEDSISNIKLSLENEIVKNKAMQALYEKIKTQPTEGKTKQQELKANIEKIRNNVYKEIGELYIDLFSRMSQEPLLIGKSNWQSLIPEFGNEVAHAYRDGLVKFWKEYKIPSPTDGEKTRIDEFSSAFGLSGLAIEAKENDLWHEGLSEEEIGRVIHYATQELNGFPVWFSRFFNKYPKQVQLLLIKKITDGFTSGNGSFSIIKHMAEMDNNFCGHFSEDFFNALMDNDCQIDLGKLRNMLIIMKKGSLATEKLLNLAKSKADLCSSLEEKALWKTLLISCDENIDLNSIFNDEDNTFNRELFLTCVKELFLNHSRIIVHDKHHRVNCLKEIYMMIEKNKFSTSTETLTNDAKWADPVWDFKNIQAEIIKLLQLDKSEESYVAFREILSYHENTDKYEVLYQQLQQKFSNNATLPSLLFKEIKEFFQSLRIIPKNPLELFDYVVTLLEDLKDELENGDYSHVDLLKLATCETMVRNYITNYFREKSNSRYTVAPENELADKKRPDIRLHGNGFDSPITIELKIANKESWRNSLHKHLTSQLCGDYMRDNRSSYGIFLLVNQDKCNTWKIDSVEVEDFDNMLEELQRYWEKNKSNYSNIKKIKIIGIDLLKR